MQVMWGTAEGTYHKHYFLYVTVFGRKIQLFRYRRKIK